MKMSLEGFQKISKEGNKTVLRHPEGHEMVINHSILSPKMRGEIEALPQAKEDDQPEQERKFAGGGDTGPSDLVKSITTTGQAASYKNELPPSPTSYKKPSGEATNVAPVKAEETEESFKKYAEGGKTESPEEADKRITDQNEAASAKQNQDKQDESVRSDAALATESKNQPQDVLAQANAQPEPAPETPEQSPTQPYDHAKDMLQAHSDAMDAHNTAMKLYAASQQPQGQAQPDQTNITAGATPGADQTAAGPAQPSQAQPEPTQPGQTPDQGQPTDQTGQPAPTSQPGTGTYDKLAGEAQGQINDLQGYIAKQNAANAKLSQAVMADKIDPNRLWNNTSTGGKITTAIGLILGGMGAGATGGRNLAVDAMNHAIERDVDAQKTNQTNQANLYRSNLEATHNEVEARNLTINQLLSAAQGQLNKAGLKNQSAVSQANVLKTNEEINALKIQNNQKSYLFKSLQPEAARTEMMDRKNLSSKLAALENFSAKYGGSSLEKLDPAIKNQGLALAADAQNAYRSANKQGVFKESESKFVNKIIHDDPSSILSGWNATPGYRQTRQSNDATLNNLKNGYGVKPFQQQQAQIPEGSTGKAKDGSTVIRRNGQWVKQ
jgi:hypothetical protein